MKRTLLFWYLLIQVIVYPALWGILYYKAHNTFYNQMDVRLKDTSAALIQTLTLNTEGDIAEEAEEQILRLVSVDTEYFSIVDAATGNVITQHPDSTDMPFAISEKVQKRLIKRHLYIWNDGLGEKNLRILGWRFHPHNNDGASARATWHLYLAYNRKDVEGPLFDLLKYTGYIYAAALLLTLLAALFISYKTLRPLKILSRDLDKVTLQRLDFRVTEPRHAELKPLTEALNSLLERVDSAFKRERQLTADIAHELRTPISGLSSILEVSLRQQRSPDEYRETLLEAKTILDQTRDMMESLLMLSRIDRGQIPMTVDVFSLKGLVDECWNVFSARGKQRALVFKNNIPESLSIHADREKTKIIVNNILSNAVAYTREGGNIEVASVTRSLDGDERISLMITNTGSQIPESDLHCIFERFWRGDKSRSATGLHFGLGLSIAHALATLQAMVIDTENVPPDKVRFTIHNLESPPSPDEE
jgi:signal transduction histidine kinase